MKGTTRQTLAARQLAVSSNTKFTAHLHNQLRKDPKHRHNLVFSSWSVTSVLSLLAQGAAASTRDQILCGLQYGGNVGSDAILGSTTNEVLYQGYSATNEDLLATTPDAQQDTEATSHLLNLANRIYLHTNYELDELFLNIAKAYYHSEPERIDFAKNVEAAGRINQWVELQTKNRIKDLVSPSSLDRTTRIVLVNAVYFKGQWEKAFQKDQTYSQPFYVNDNESVPVEMMSNYEDSFLMGILNDLDAIACELPYKGGTMSMILLLPKVRFQLDNVEEKLMTHGLDEAWKNSSLTKQKILLHVPKFRIESSIDLNGTLQALGMRDMFEPSRASLGGIIKSNGSSGALFVSQIIQKAFIEVNEVGTEAAAATAMMCPTGFAISKPPPEFRCDQPFLFFIRHNSTGLVLFSGRVDRPEE
eukprot:CAMPEP_0184694866 /NCGR_PEP_ID=MMETSP0313-20130426/2690_1 /TAXON_ID=2792 /ORGANISM="Porphyridium aerugineum, Strain SAG 1380-2" /LENGTH=416 /DNA_ID=CAMNT_0027153225 /DNA_START=64 /DNA_END=1314 /DNA_ORIENTATION=+